MSQKGSSIAEEIVREQKMKSYYKRLADRRKNKKKRDIDKSIQK